MIEALKIDFTLFRRQMNLYDLGSIIPFVGVLSILFLGFKYLIGLTPNPFAATELFALGLAFLGGFKVHSETISSKQVKMITFFPHLKTKDVKRYFLYKKPFFVYFFTFYLLFPPRFTQELLLASFFFLSVIMLMMFVNTLSYRFLPSEAWANNIYLGLRIGYFIVFAGYLFVDFLDFDLKNFVVSLDLWYLVLIGIAFSIINLFILPYPNKKESQDD
ncbi:hypothetical protein GCM10025886_12750 [Tetragenococcus halophilus subsp. flandriensis]|uniref:hypothetical protein n=1 Tax=Tetragenococcus halophilus TaxID=51669 RepID=UPI0023EA067C|nr:hypothetical protein [Tetragenococcus halophilus]GMA08124.1 hypothetical protein GCM10025886_12750 [Tetragenococcus halophilus subsp. flandriensis]